MRADTKVRPYKKSLTIALYQRERKFWEWFSSIISKRCEPAILKKVRTCRMSHIKYINYEVILLTVIQRIAMSDDRYTDQAVFRPHFFYLAGNIICYTHRFVRYTHHNRVDLDLYPTQPKWGIHR